LGGRGLSQLVQSLSQAARVIWEAFVALNHLAVAIIAFRKVLLNINVVYG
jgi:hypothetical protein